MMPTPPRLTSVMGVARILLAAVGPRETAGALVAEFGWDVSLQALALLRGEAAGKAFGHVWARLATDPAGETASAPPLDGVE